jgi:hypothetical protein
MRFLRLVLVFLALGLAVSAGGAQAQVPRLRAGVAAVKITPSLTRTVYIAGYESNRVADAVHDDLWARALVLDDGQTRIAVVALDLVGLFNARVRQIRSRIAAVPPDNVLITCTHVHSGPDTMGLWGPNPFTTGVDPLYMARLEDRIVAAVEQASRNLRPVRLLAGKTQVPDGFVHNSREPLQDKQLTALRFVEPDGRTVGTVIHYGGHPEVNKSKALTSDFVHYTRQAVEARFGGVALFVNGALGGMVTPKISGHTWEETERVGKGVGVSAVAAAESAEELASTRITLRRRDVELPLENPGFQLFMKAKIFDPPMAAAMRTDGKLTTEVWRLDLGRICLVTLPGEILPKPALQLKSMMPGPYRLVVGLGNDELGYILDPEDFDTRRYSYEKSMSVGKQAWPLLLKAAQELLY